MARGVAGRESKPSSPGTHGGTENKNRHNEHASGVRLSGVATMNIRERAQSAQCALSL